MPVIDNCADFNNKGVCVMCEPNHFLTQSKKCFLLPPLCGRLNDNGECIGCQDIRRTFRNGVCILPSPNCEGYNTTTGLCSKCSQFNYFQGEFCLPNPTGCENANQQGICIDCIEGYIKSGQ